VAFSVRFHPLNYVEGPHIQQAMGRIQILIPALFLAGQLSAQDGGNVLATNMAANAKLLEQYTYKQRTEIKFKGEGRFVRVNQIHLDANGKLQKTLVSQTGGGAQPSGIAKALIEKKRQELMDYGSRINMLVENYFPIDPQKLGAALKRAELGGNGNTVSLIIRNYYEQGDTMSIIVDPINKKLQKFELTTTLDKDPVSVTADMNTIPKGPIYPSFIKVKAPAKDLEIDISQYDYVKQ
jgi:hypothetical protein